MENKFETLLELEEYFYNNLPEDSRVYYTEAVLDEKTNEGVVFGFDLECDCDVIIGSFIRRGKYYFV